MRSATLITAIAISLAAACGNTETDKTPASSTARCPRVARTELTASSMPASAPTQDCCEVCTQIYVTCGLTIKDKQQQPLAAQQCLSSCGSAARAQTFYGCVATKSGSQDTCDAAVLQTCFDAM